MTEKIKILKAQHKIIDGEISTLFALHKKQCQFRYSIEDHFEGACNDIVDACNKERKRFDIGNNKFSEVTKKYYQWCIESNCPMTRGF